MPRSSAWACSATASAWVRPRLAPAADALESLLEALVGLFHRLIGRAPFLNALLTLGSRLPMTYRGSRTIAQTFAKKARQNRRAKVTTVVTSLTYAHSLDQRKAEPNPVSMTPLAAALGVNCVWKMRKHRCPLTS